MSENFTSHYKWDIPQGGIEIETIDAHTEGEPLRVILKGFPSLPGKTMLEKRRFAHDNYDHLRTALMWEPRGHADMYGCLITPPERPDSDFGVLFLHNEGYSTMCGHGIIAVTKVALESGIIEKKSPESIVKIDTPAGLVTAFARVGNDKVISVCFHNVPSFVFKLDAHVHVPGIGTVNYDIAFGGAFYAFVSADELGISLNRESFRQLIDIGMRIKHAVMESQPIHHPFEKDLNFLYGTIFIGTPEDPHVHSRNVCIFAEGEVDRSPTGTGVSARIALHYARHEANLNQSIEIESIIGSRFKVQALEEIGFGPYTAVIPMVEGRTHITGQHKFFIDPDDTLKHGYILR